jgi:hypothetical protein
MTEAPLPNGAVASRSWHALSTEQERRLVQSEEVPYVLSEQPQPCVLGDEDCPPLAPIVRIKASLVLDVVHPSMHQHRNFHR